MADTIHTYNSWGAFIRAADQTNDLNPTRRSSRDVSRPSWHGSHDWQETIDLAMRGWPEGLRRIKEQVTVIERFIGPTKPRLDLAYAVQGPGTLDFNRYQQGRPDSWVIWEDGAPQDGQSIRIVPIVFNLSTSGRVSTEVMFRRGAAVCALVDVLEHSNIRVEVILVEYATYGYGSAYAWKVMLKRAEDILDMDRLAFALCHASVLRRLMFSLAEQYVPHLSGSYGSPRTWYEDGAINLDSASLSVRGAEDMVPWLIGQLAGYGIEVDK